MSAFASHGAELKGNLYRGVKAEEVACGADRFELRVKMKERQAVLRVEMARDDKGNARG